MRLTEHELQLIICEYENNLAQKGYYTTAEAVLVTRRVELLKRWQERLAGNESD